MTSGVLGHATFTDSNFHLSMNTHAGLACNKIRSL
jgi:hypothetical protein